MLLAVLLLSHFEHLLAPFHQLFVQGGDLWVLRFFSEGGTGALRVTAIAEDLDPPVGTKRLLERLALLRRALRLLLADRPSLNAASELTTQARDGLTAEGALLTGRNAATSAAAWITLLLLLAKHRGELRVMPSR